MIKSLTNLKEIEIQKKEVSCKNCKHFNLGAYHSGKWCCEKVSVFDAGCDIEKCFEREE